MGSGQSTNPNGHTVGVKAMSYFNLKKFLKDPSWYEVARYEKFYKENCQTLRSDYVLDTKNGSVNVDNFCGHEKVDTCVIKKKSLESRGGDLLITPNGEDWGEFNILWSDYKNITFVAGKDYTSIWVLSRENVETDEHRECICECLDKLIVLCGKNNIHKSKLVWNNGEHLHDVHQ